MDELGVTPTTARKALDGFADAQAKVSEALKESSTSLDEETRELKGLQTESEAAQNKLAALAVTQEATEAAMKAGAQRAKDYAKAIAGSDEPIQTAREGLKALGEMQSERGFSEVEALSGRVEYLKQALDTLREDTTVNMDSEAVTALQERLEAARAELDKFGGSQEKAAEASVGLQRRIYDLTDGLMGLSREDGYLVRLKALRDRFVAEKISAAEFAEEARGLASAIRGARMEGEAYIDSLEQIEGVDPFGLPDAPEDNTDSLAEIRDEIRRLEEERANVEGTGSEARGERERLQEEIDALKEKKRQLDGAAEGTRRTGKAARGAAKDYDRYGRIADAALRGVSEAVAENVVEVVGLGGEMSRLGEVGVSALQAVIAEFLKAKAAAAGAALATEGFGGALDALTGGAGGGILGGILGGLSGDGNISGGDILGGILGGGGGGTLPGGYGGIPQNPMGGGPGGTPPGFLRADDLTAALASTGASGPLEGTGVARVPSPEEMMPSAPSVPAQQPQQKAPQAGGGGVQEIHITGEFRQRGGDLVAVVDRTRYTNDRLG